MDIFIAKFKASGEKDWVKQIGSEHSDYAQGVAVDAHNSVYITGYTNGKLDDPATWARGGSNIAGFRQSGAASSFDAVIIKLGGTGSVIWSKQYSSISTGQYPGNDFAFSVSISPPGATLGTGQLVLVGGFTSGMWQAGANSLVTNSGTLTEGHEVLQGAEARARTCATASTSRKRDIQEKCEDAMVLAVEASSGELVWLNQFGASMASDRIYGMAVDGRGGVYSVGHTRGSMPGGREGAGENLTAASAGASGGAGVGGVQEVLQSHDDLTRGGVQRGDLFLAKLDAHTGKRLWVRQLGTAFEDLCYNPKAKEGKCAVALGPMPAAAGGGEQIVYMSGMTSGPFGDIFHQKERNLTKAEVTKIWEGDNTAAWKVPSNPLMCKRSKKTCVNTAVLKLVDKLDGAAAEVEWVWQAVGAYSNFPSGMITVPSMSESATGSAGGGAAGGGAAGAEGSVDVIVIGSADQRLLRDSLSASATKSTDSMLLRIGDRTSSNQVDALGTSATGGASAGGDDVNAAAGNHSGLGHVTTVAAGSAVLRAIYRSAGLVEDRPSTRYRLKWIESMDPAHVIPADYGAALAVDGVAFAVDNSVGSTRGARLSPDVLDKTIIGNGRVEGVGLNASVEGVGLNESNGTNAGGSVRTIPAYHAPTPVPRSDGSFSFHTLRYGDLSEPGQRADESLLIEHWKSFVMGGGSSSSDSASSAGPMSAAAVASVASVLVEQMPFCQDSFHFTQHELRVTEGKGVKVEVRLVRNGDTNCGKSAVRVRTHDVKPQDTTTTAGVGHTVVHHGALDEITEYTPDMNADSPRGELVFPARAGKDYMAYNRLVHFAEGQTEARLNISIIDDKIVEREDEQFKVVLELRNDQGGALSPDQLGQSPGVFVVASEGGIGEYDRTPLTLLTAPSTLIIFIHDNDEDVVGELADGAVWQQVSHEVTVVIAAATVISLILGIGGCWTLRRRRKQRFRYKFTSLAVYDLDNMGPGAIASPDSKQERSKFNTKRNMARALKLKKGLAKPRKEAGKAPSRRGGQPVLARPLGLR
jgi:hypothetical protein